ncbi:MAG TPA: alpha/beta hydrolase-fold protein [Actinomycetota bacterium]|nr:alpha/beta hydrolase-fold protein [Actinomycetota bacterium]
MGASQIAGGGGDGEGLRPEDTASGPEVEENEIVFRIPDPDRELAGVRLYQEIDRPRNGPEFSQTASGAWELRWARPQADRVEYQVELLGKDGSSGPICDPFNPRTTPGVFGDKSVVEVPGYRPPAWLDEELPFGARVETAVKSRILRAELPLIVWSSAGTTSDQELPLLIVHDGPEFDALAQLTRFLAYATTTGRVPPMRAALLGPMDRNQIFSASAAYARAFAHEILPKIVELAPTPHGRTHRIGMGASLGGLSMLHLHRRNPATFGALYLQSGSFFRQRFDSQESDFVRFRRISRFVGSVLTSEMWAHPIPLTITCGLAEENLRNNEAMRDALARQGYDVTWVDHRDAHNWVSWRDTFDPHLGSLLASQWSGAQRTAP